MNGQTTLQNRLNLPILIHPQTIKDLNDIGANINNATLSVSIYDAQLLHIRKVLGTTLYNRLTAEWEVARRNPNQLPDGTFVDMVTTPDAFPPIIVGDDTNYKELYQQITMPLTKWSYVMSLPNIAIKVDEAGIMLNRTDYSSSAGLVGLDKLVQEGEAIARSYTELLIQYICDTFKSDEEVANDAKQVSGRSMGMFIPRRPHHKRRRGCVNC